MSWTDHYEQQAELWAAVADRYPPGNRETARQQAWDNYEVYRDLAEEERKAEDSNPNRASDPTG